MRILPRSPRTRCQGMPFPEGVAAMARPALRAPPGRRKALARPHMLKPGPGEFVSRSERLDSRTYRNQAPSKGGEKLVTNPRCPPLREQEENGETGFNAVVG